MVTTTPVLGLIKPIVGGDTDLWGEMLNTNSDTIDSAMGAVETEIAANKFPAGTRLLFQQSAAPPGWTKIVDQNDKALRVVSGAASTGGSAAFSTVFGSKTPAGSISSVTSTGTVGDTALSIAQMPLHSHSQSHFSTGNATAPAATSGAGISAARNATPILNGVQTEVVGSGATHTHTLSMTSHSHTFTGTAMDFAVQYVDVIIAAKN